MVSYILVWKVLTTYGGHHLFFTNLVGGLLNYVITKLQFLSIFVFCYNRFFPHGVWREGFDTSTGSSLLVV